MFCHESAPSTSKTLTVQERNTLDQLGEAIRKAQLSQKKDKASSSNMNRNLQESGKPPINSSHPHLISQLFTPPGPLRPGRWLRHGARQGSV